MYHWALHRSHGIGNLFSIFLSILQSIFYGCTAALLTNTCVGTLEARGTLGG